MKTPRNGFLQTFVPTLRNGIGLLLVIIAPCPWHVCRVNCLMNLDEYQLLSDRQHAFRNRHSCETQLTTVINDWVKIFDKGGQIDTFILDSEKSFDSPPHELLKSKLLGYCIGGKTPILIDSFLCYRTTSCCKRWNFGLGSSFARCPTRGRTWSIIVLSVYKWYFQRQRLRYKTFRRWLFLLS